jgi:hypothetical protein
VFPRDSVAGIVAKVLVAYYRHCSFCGHLTTFWIYSLGGTKGVVDGEFSWTYETLLLGAVDVALHTQHAIS